MHFRKTPTTEGRDSIKHDSKDFFLQMKTSKAEGVQRV